MDRGFVVAAVVARVRNLPGLAERTALREWLAEKVAGLASQVS